MKPSRHRPERLAEAVHIFQQTLKHLDRPELCEYLDRLGLPQQAFQQIRDGIVLIRDKLRREVD